jgi:chromosome segregation ATPase
MDLFGLDIAHVIATAASGIIGALLTYFATRKQSEVSEKTIYIGAVESLTTTLRGEIERLGASREELLTKVETMERWLDELEASERMLKRRVAELEANEKKLLGRIEDLEGERDRLRAERDRLREQVTEIKDEISVEGPNE